MTDATGASAAAPERDGSGARRLIKAVGRRVARLLPPPRDEALIAIGRSAWALVTGRPTRAANGSGSRSAPREPFVDPLTWRRVHGALRQGDLEGAHERVAAIVERHPTSFKALRLKRDVEARLGRLTDAVETTRRMRRLIDDDSLAHAERLWLGRLIETDPRWLPPIPGPPRPVEPRGPGVVMHLLKESVPYLENGFTMRSWYTLLSQRRAGLDPFAVTSVGFPRRTGVTDFPAVDEVEGIRHHRLDLGPGYPALPPFDQQLTDHAWLAARVGRAERPAVIHAHSGFRGFDAALVGLALGRHLVRPVVYEVRSFLETTWSGDLEQSERGEHYERRYATETRCMLAADAVVTIADAMRDDMVARGVPEDRVHVVPNGVDAERFVPMEKDPDLVRRYDLEGRLVFGYVSTLDHPREGQELLIEATAKLLARGRNVACLIVGGGRRRAELEALARAAGVVNAVRFTGRVAHDEIQAHFALLDLFVVPRRNDRASRHVTPLKPFEAMAMARPLVVADLPALVEIAAPGERGVAFAHEDAEALAAAIDGLIDQPDRRRQLGEAGRAWVMAERSWERNGERYAEIYSEILARRPGPERVAVAAAT